MYSADGWWVGENKQRQQGYFPANHVTPPSPYSPLLDQSLPPLRSPAARRKNLFLFCFQCHKISKSMLFKDTFLLTFRRASPSVAVIIIRVVDNTHIVQNQHVDVTERTCWFCNICVTSLISPGLDFNQTLNSTREWQTFDSDDMGARYAILSLTTKFNKKIK